MKKKKTKTILLIAAAIILVAALIWAYSAYKKKNREVRKLSRPKSSVISNTSPESRWVPAQASPETTVVTRSPNSFGAGHTKRVVLNVPLF